MSKKTDLEIIEAATPGPWNREVYDIYTIGLGPIRSHEYNPLCDENSGHDLEFVLHFNPLRVAEILHERDEAIKSLEAEIRQLKELRRQFAIRELGYDPYEDEQNGIDVDKDMSFVHTPCNLGNKDPK
jgi:hypothetical protein